MKDDKDDELITANEALWRCGYRTENARNSLPALERKLGVKRIKDPNTKRVSFFKSDIDRYLAKLKGEREPVAPAPTDPDDEPGSARANGFPVSDLFAHMSANEWRASQDYDLRFKQANGCTPWEWIERYGEDRVPIWVEPAKTKR